jgi:hypothetical protein
MYQPKTGAKCGCRRGAQRDNCPNCEGTGMVIDFREVRRAVAVAMTEREAHLIRIEDKP